MILIGATIYLVLLSFNIWLAPHNDVIWETFDGFDVTGKAVVMAVAVGYVVLSFGIIALFWRAARMRQEERPDIRKDVRDGAWLVFILSSGSLIPTGFAALMRGDSATSGPLVNGTIIVVIAVVAFSIAIVLAIAAAAHRNRSA